MRSKVSEKCVESASNFAGERERERETVSE